MAILDKKTLTGFFGIPAGTKLYNWLNPCCDEFCNDVKACTGIQTVRVSYLMTTQDIANGYAVVPITFPKPFTDTNYTVVFGINDLDPAPAGSNLDYYVGDIHQKTTTGFNAVIMCYSPAYGTPGDIEIINAIAIHD